MKKILTAIMMLLMVANTVYAQNADDPVVDYESTAGRNDHIHIKNSSSILGAQGMRIKNLNKNIKEKSYKLHWHKAERQVKDLNRGIGVIGYTMTEELRNEFNSYIKNAKRSGKTLIAVYKLNGKEIVESFEVYLTPKTPWTGPLDPNEMWDKLPCDRELKRFYMSKNDYNRIFEFGKSLERKIMEIDKQVKNQTNSGK